MERVRPQVAGQPARDRGRDRWDRRRQSERLQQGAQAYRRGDQRLLRAGVLLEESGRHETATANRSEGDSQRGADVVPQGIRAETSAQTGVVLQEITGWTQVGRLR